MVVPDLVSVLLPLLRAISDGQTHSVAELIEQLAEELALSDEDRRELLPSGREFRFDNRVWWARTYLVKAGLAAKGRGTMTITDAGLEVLASGPDRIDIKFLCQYESFKRFFANSDRQYGSSTSHQQTPEEILESAYQELRQGVMTELLERVCQCTPSFFEKLVVDLLVAMGYGGSRKDAGQAIGQVGDEGIDGIVKEDWLGLDTVYIQAKKWRDTVGRAAVQAFAGTLEGVRARKGVFITTSRFSREAREYVTRIEKRIVLIDGTELASLMLDHAIGVDGIAGYTVFKVDQDYFGDIA